MLCDVTVQPSGEHLFLGLQAVHRTDSEPGADTLWMHGVPHHEQEQHPEAAESGFSAILLMLRLRMKLDCYETFTDPSVGYPMVWRSVHCFVRMTDISNLQKSYVTVHLCLVNSNDSQVHIVHS